MRKGSKVRWKWGNGTAVGKVAETHSQEVSRTIKGSEITRKGEKGNKSLLIRQDDGENF